MPSCVIIVENLPVPLDRRVWQEARALKEAGWRVFVICPATERFPARRETIDGISIFRHPLPLEARGMWGFIVEYAMALFHETRLLITIRRSYDFDVIQGCNPPDLIFLVALPWKLFGKKFVFDHHDVCPELMEAKFGKKRILRALLLLAERLTFATADLVISANETFRQLAITRGGKRPAEIVAVYSIPDKRFFGSVQSAIPKQSNADIGNGRKMVIGYVGIIGDQDGVDNIVRMARELAGRHGLRDFICVIVGDGPALQSIRSLADELDVAKYVRFTGYLTGRELLEALSEFDIGVIPDPVNTYNDKISMNKVFEYSAMGIPIVAFNLSESKRLLKDAALFASSSDASGLADEVARLIHNPELRCELGRKSRALADREFIWEAEAQKYVAAMTQLLAR
jgi:glycosyltransferase involved in cell wall biosynthesis